MAVLGGCGVFSAPMGAGGPLVAEHLGYMRDYLDSDDTERRRMRQELEGMPMEANAKARLRYAIMLSLDEQEPGTLERSLAMLERLEESNELAPAERWLARLWRGEVENRLSLHRQNRDARVALREAEEKLEQLTVIEEELEAENNGAGER